MLAFFAPLLLLAQGTFAAPFETSAATVAAATVGKIRGVRDPIYHLYLQASPKNGKHILPWTCISSYLPCLIPIPIEYRTIGLSDILPASGPVLGPESAADEFTIGGTIQSRKTKQYLNIASASTSYKPLVWGAKEDTTAWGLEGDTIITVQGSSYGWQLNFLACTSTDAGYYDLYLQTGSDAPSGKTCSNFQTIHLPCLC